MKIKSLLLSLITLFLLASCSFQGLPYPTDTAVPPTADLEATREMVEAGMSPSETPIPLATETPQPTATPDKDAPRALPTGKPFQIPGQILQLTYTLDGELWFWQEGQDPQRLTERGDVYLASLSPDASRIAYAAAPEYGTRELWVVDVDSQQSRLLIDSGTFQTLTKFPDNFTAAPLQLAWIPGTDLVVFSTGMISDWPTISRWREVISVDTESLTLTNLADFDSGGNITLSPDGSQIAILSPDTVSLVNADGSNLRKLFSFPHVMTESEFWIYPDLAWTADGSALRMILPPENPRFEPNQPTKIFQLNLNGTQRILASIQMASILFFDPLLSLDGSHLLYIGSDGDENTGTGTLFHSRADGNQGENFANGDINPLAWSPDNRHFIYRRGGSAYLGQVGEDPIKLNEVFNPQDAAFIDPGRFLIASEGMESWQLWLGTLDGSIFLIAESEIEITFDFVQ